MGQLDRKELSMTETYCKKWREIFGKNGIKMPAKEVRNEKVQV
jgi:hypothetical protein